MEIISLQEETMRKEVVKRKLSEEACLSRAVTDLAVLLTIIQLITLSEDLAHVVLL